jgi:nicotinamidase-related amidase
MQSQSPRRALIVIDVQNEYVSGALRIEYPPVEESLLAIAQAMDHAKSSGVPIVAVQNRAPASSPLFAEGSHGWELHETVARRHRDHLLHKELPSALARTELREWLVQRAIDTVTIIGYMTHNCDMATAVDATQAGYAVELLSDATGSVPYTNAAGSATAQQIHDAFCVVMQSRFAAVVTTQQWMDAVTAGERLARGSIHASHTDALRLRKHVA